MRNILPVACIAVGVLTACATSYQPVGATGGFEETKLAAGLYQVSFTGNGYTLPARVSQFVLRRCAELTLENRKQFFLLADDAPSSTTSGARGWVFSAPSGKTTLRILDRKEDAPIEADAVIVIEETNAAAGGRLSKGAASYLGELLKTYVSPEGLTVGARLFTRDGQLIGTVRFFDSESTSVELDRGGIVNMKTSDAEKRLRR